MNVKLLVVQGRPAGKTLAFTVGEYYFGRGAECHVRPNSEWVSRQHCLLRVTAGEVHLRDLGSRNGTLVNGTRLHEECQLHDGDLVQIGPLVFKIQFDAATMPPDGKAAFSSSEPLEMPTETLAALESTENLPAIPEAPSSGDS
jgi:pSer/pThr/pTyr-binding forkhead associated (FHA) protein